MYFNGTTKEIKLVMDRSSFSLKRIKGYNTPHHHQTNYKKKIRTQEQK